MMGTSGAFFRICRPTQNPSCIGILTSRMTQLVSLSIPSTPCVPSGHVWTVYLALRTLASELRMPASSSMTTTTGRPAAGPLGPPPTILSRSSSDTFASTSRPFERRPSFFSLAQHQARKLEVREHAPTALRRDFSPWVHPEPRDLGADGLLDVTDLFERLLVPQEWARAGSTFESQRNDRGLADELLLHPVAHLEPAVVHRFDGAMADVNRRSHRDGREQRQLLGLFVDPEHAAADEALRIVGIALGQTNAENPSPVVDVKGERAEKLLRPDVEGRLSVELLEHVS